MFEKYLYALGRGVRGVRRALDEQRRDETPDPAATAKDITPPKPAPDHGDDGDATPQPHVVDAGTPALPYDPIEIGGRTLIMGIVNVTPDSFSDGGRYFDPQRAVEQALRLAAEGADILDIGGESTRPGAEAIDAREEWARIEPVIRALVRQTRTPVSIDTMKAGVAAAALEAGAAMVNDVWGFQFDPQLPSVVAAADAHCVVMHNRQNEDPAIDIFEDVRVFLARSLDLALAAGVRRERIVIDPGIGFGKTNQQSMIMVQRLGDLKAAFELPVLLGLSRKRMIGEATGRKIAAQRDAGAVAANLFGLEQGADILRVHNVAAHVDALRMWKALRNA